MNKKILIVFIVLIISAISFSRSFLGLIGVIPWHYGYSDVYNSDRIDQNLVKKIPYLENPVEYPVITGFFIYAMWHLGKNILGYVVYTSIFLTLFTIVTALAIDKLVDILKIKETRLFWFFIFAPSLVLFEIYNWDMMAVMLMVLAMYFFYQNKYAWAALLLSLGFNAKFFPILILPIMLLKTDLKQGVKMALVFLITSIVLNFYFVINSFDVWKATYQFHSLREPNIDSIWSISHLGANAINTLSLALFILSYFALVLYHKKYDLISLSFASVLLFLLFNKVFSPQYMLWLLPFFVLSAAVTKKLFYSLEFVNLIVFFLALNILFNSKEQIFLNVLNILVITRSLILIYILYLLSRISKNINYIY